MYLFYRFLRFFRMCFLLLFIIICSYFISGFGAGNIYCVSYFLYFLCLCFLYINEYEYSCCLACRCFYKPVLAQHDQCCMCIFLNRGTGMIASSSTFRPHSGRVIRDLFRLLDAVTALYGSTSLQQSSKGSCSLLVSGYNLRADCQWCTLVPPLNSGASAAPASVLALM